MASMTALTESDQEDIRSQVGVSGGGGDIGGGGVLETDACHYCL